MPEATVLFSSDQQSALVVLWDRLVVDLTARLEVLSAEGRLEHPKVQTILPQEIEATTEGGRHGGQISIWLDVYSGQGSWNQIVPQNECEPWSMTPEGIATLSEEQLSVHELADRFAAKLITRP